MQPRHHAHFQVNHLNPNRLISLTLFLILIQLFCVIGAAQPQVPQVGSSAPSSNASSSKAGSILFFHKYTSDTSQSDKVNSLLTLTNTNPTEGVTVRLVAVHNCTTVEKFINLAANQSRTLLASKEFPDTTGYLIAIAVNEAGAPTQFNWIVGSASVRDWLGNEGAYNAFAVAKRSAGSLGNAGTGYALVFDGKEYDRLPQTVAVDSIQSVETDIAVYSPPSALGTDQYANFSLNATLYDYQGVGHDEIISDYGCGLFDQANYIWYEKPLPEYVGAGKPGWARFTATDLSDEKRHVAVPVLGVSTGGASVATRRGTISMQVLDWLERYTITLASRVPVNAAVAGSTTDQPGSVEGATGASESKAGSVLFFPRVVGDAQGETLISLTNTHPAQKARVRLFFSAMAPNPAVSEQIITIEPLHSVTLNSGSNFVGQRGWIMAAAINRGAQVIKFNHLIGSAYLTESSGAVSAYNALAVAKITEGAVDRNEDKKTADLIFDDVNFDRLPSSFAISGIANQLYNNSYLSYSRLAASLLDLPNTRGTAATTVYDASLNAYTGLIGPLEFKLGDLRNIRLSPSFPASGIQANAGWMRLALTSPSLAALANYPTSALTQIDSETWIGGLPGSTNLHILGSAEKYTLKVPAGNPGNQIPTAEFTPLQYTLDAKSSAGTAVRLDGSASTDPDPDDTLTYKWFINGKEASTQVIWDYRLPRGRHEVRLVVTDSSGESSEPFFQDVEVRDLSAPVISQIPTLVEATTTGTSAIVQYAMPTAFDSVDGSVRVTASRPSGSAFPLGTTVITFTAVDAAGNRATATTEVFVAAGAVNAQVGGVAGNATPFLANIEDQILKPGEVRRITLQAVDADNDQLTFRLAGAPSSIVIGNIDPVGGKATLIIGPLPETFAPTQVRLSVSDSAKQSYSILPFTISVSPVPNTESGIGAGSGSSGGRSNRAPVAVMNPIASTIEATEADGAFVTLDGSNSIDPDLDSLTYVWTDNGVVIAQGIRATVKLSIGVHSLVLTVNDGQGGVTSTQPATVEIQPRGLSVTSFSPSRMRLGFRYNVVLEGSGFTAGTRVFLGNGITVGIPISLSEGRIAFAVTVSNTAIVGTRDVVVINPDGRIATLRAGLTVQR